MLLSLLIILLLLRNAGLIRIKIWHLELVSRIVDIVAVVGGVLHLEQVDIGLILLLVLSG